MNYENVINMLSLWINPGMWGDITLYAEINEVIKKLSNSAYQLTERELFLTQELTNGLLEATLSSFNKADDSLKDEYKLALDEIIKFQSFLVADTQAH